MRMKGIASWVLVALASVMAGSGLSEAQTASVSERDSAIIDRVYGVYVATEDGIDAYAFTTDPRSGTSIAGSPFAAGRSFTSVLQSNSRLYAIEAMGNEYRLLTFGIDRLTGALSPLGSLEVPGEAMVLDPAGATIYIVSRVSSEEEEQLVLGLTLDPVTGLPVPLPGQAPSIGRNRDCYEGVCQVRRVTVHPSARFVFARGSGAYYDDRGRPVDSVFVLHRNPSTGAMEVVPGSPYPLSGSALSQRYSLLVHPSGAYLYSVEMGCGTAVDIFRVDQQTGALASVDSIAPGDGGTTFNSGATLHPTGRWFYLQQDNDWADGRSELFSIDSESGRLTWKSSSHMLLSDGGWGHSNLVLSDPGGLALLERWNLALGMFWVDSSTGQLTEVTPSRFRGARAVTFFEDRTAFACVYTDIAPEYGPWDGPMLLKAVSVDSVHRSLVELNEQGLAVGRNPSGIAVATLSPHR